MRRSIIVICLTLAAASLAAVPSAAAGKARSAKPKKPVITRVLPMRVEVGERLTIRGRHFKRKRKRNTIVFRAPNGRSVFAKPRRARARKLVVVVPAAVSRLLVRPSGKQSPMRFKLRVLAGRFSRFTKRRLSPVVVSGGRDAGGGKDGGGKTGPDGQVVKVCNASADHDHDLLANDVEIALGTDPCLADTDGDLMTDGWEYYSAKDLNIKAVPYPGKRPFPNALDPSDGSGGQRHSAWDFDGDGLTTYEEYRLWRYTGSHFDPAKAGGLGLESPLGYSDGTKFSRLGETPLVPAWRGPLYGLPAPVQPFPATFNHKGDVAWRDDERDADADGLSNWLESARGPSRNSWWQGYWGSFEPAPEPWPKTYFGYFDRRPFAELDLADPDVDGDTLLDGEDDQDNDDFNNITELYELLMDLDGDGNPDVDGKGRPYPSIDLGGSTRYVNAMNPCAPDPLSRTCDDYPPFD